MSKAFLDGCQKMGWQFELTTERHLIPRADVLMAYGWIHQQELEAYRLAGLHYIHADLGYWDRKRGRGDFDSNHKIVVDGRHATSYFRRIKRPHDRLAGAPQIQPWKNGGRHIVLAGLSAKGAVGSGLRPMSWENETIEKLRKLTDRPIFYRPKPSWKEARPIRGTTFSPGTDSIEVALQGAHALVTLHSNAALDALAAGVPICAVEGLSSTMSGSLETIETPWRPDDRQQFFADVGYQHWRRAAVADGTVFARLRDEGLLS